MKTRLDIYLTLKNLTSTRTKAQSLIKDGLVFVNDKVATKPSIEVDDDDLIKIKEHDEYVSRGAYKLLGALQSFKLDFNHKTVLDIGASTGGFTQVALQHGAIKVYALDVGKDQLDKILVQNSKVVNMSGRDIRTLEKEEVKDVELIIGDLSFISLTKILPYIKELFGKIETMFLFKPQFECGMQIAKKNKGIIKDKQIHIKLLNEFIEFTNLIDFKTCNIAPSPITGGDGNHEYLIHFNAKPQKFDINKIIENAFKNKN